MRASLWQREGKSKSSIAISVAIHVVVVAALATITFHYPLSEIFTKAEPIKAVPVRYIKLQPRAPQTTVTRRAPTPTRTAPAALPAVVNTPAAIPAPALPVSPSTSAIGAGGEATPTRDPGIGFGLRPGIPDGRLATNPSSLPRAPETDVQKAERILSSYYQQYLDSARAAMANPQRQPGDWSWGGSGGDKWGWDQNGIHVGGITIPNIVLAALPIPVSGNASPVDVRARNFVSSDLAYYGRVMSEDEFKSAVKRVRERVDRERRERMEKAKEKEKKAPPCCE